MLDLVDIRKQQYVDNLGGLMTTAYFANYHDLEVIPSRDLEYSALVGDYAPAATISSDFVFKTGKCFKQIDGVLGKNSLSTAGAGEVESRSHETTVVWQLPAVSARNIGFLELMKNEWWIALIPDRNGLLFTLGAEGLPAVLSESAVQTGATVAEERMTSITLRYEGFVPRIYQGNILLDPAPAPAP
jgi:hypothetical protein